MAWFDGLENNTSNYAPDKLDYGIKVARKGYNVLTADSTGILYNSTWKIIQMGANITGKDLQKLDTISISIDGYNYTCYKFYHGLGYVPLLLDFSSYFGLGATDIMFLASKEWAYIYVDTSVVNIDVISLVICPIDIRQDVDYRMYSKPLYLFDSDRLSDYGLSSTIHGKNTHSKALRDFSMNIKLFPQIILAVKTEKSMSQNNWIERSSGNYYCALVYKKPKEIEYIPTAIGFAYCGSKDSDGNEIYRLLPSVAGQTLGNYLWLNDAKNGKFVESLYSSVSEDNCKGSLVIIRMPMVAPTIQEISV